MTGFNLITEDGTLNRVSAAQEGARWGVHFGCGAWGQPNYSVYPEMQVYVNRSLAGDFAVLGSAVAYTGFAATTVIVFRRRALTVSIIDAKIRVVRIDSPGFQEAPVQHDGPENKQRRRRQHGQESRFRAPAQEEAIPPRRGQKHRKQASSACNKAKNGCLRIGGQLEKEFKIVHRCSFRKS